MTAPKGFLASGVRAGIKKVKKPDLALVLSETACRAAAVFTSNQVKAAPVLFDIEQLTHRPIQGVVINSGNANACTGSKGLANARKTAALASKMFEPRGKGRESKFFVCSTGRIGVQLPMGKIEAAVPQLFKAVNRDGGARAARAIMTSDSFPKEFAVAVRIGAKTVRIGGIAKGAGMIEPRMTRAGAGLHATMLCVITTDVVIGDRLLQKSLEAAVGPSFNSISVDGDTSTNDTVLLLANGQAGNPPIRGGTPAHRIFQQGLNRVALELAKMIVRDGEGMSRFVTVRINGCRTATDAEKMGRAVINSMLVKSAWSGGDPNWGRVLAALGYSGALLQESRVRVWYDRLLLVQGGRQNDAQVPAVKRVVKKPSFEVTIDAGLGKYCRIFYTTDLTEKYVAFNKTE